MYSAQANPLLLVEGANWVEDDPKDQKPRPGHLRLVEHAPPADAPASFEDEVDLVRRTAEQDADAFRILVDRHLTKVVAGARRILNDESEAEDIAQETFIRLWRGAGRLEIGPMGVQAWLKRVGRNLAIDRIRATQKLVSEEDAPERSTDAEQDIAVADKERAHQVSAALSALPDRQRLALTLFHFEEMPQNEVAEAMSCSVEAVESLLARARRRLKQDLGDVWRNLIDDDSRHDVGA